MNTLELWRLTVSRLGEDMLMIKIRGRNEAFYLVVYNLATYNIINQSIEAYTEELVKLYNGGGER